MCGFILPNLVSGGVRRWFKFGVNVSSRAGFSFSNGFFYFACQADMYPTQNKAFLDVCGQVQRGCADLELLDLQSEYS
eukprot:766853-Hanusia_phi.AAC.4